MSEKLDLLVIGSGPGGYTAAVKAAQMGLSVACAESYENLGGTCLNVGCIPSKSLLHATSLYHRMSGRLSCSASEYMTDMMSEKSGTVRDLNKGIDYLFKKNNVTQVLGRVSFTGHKSVEVNGKTLEPENIIIATGSKPSPLPGVEFSGRVISSTEALSLSSIPEEMVVIGAGNIGLEMGSVWNRLGVKVTVVELSSRVLATSDGEVSKEIEKVLKSQGIDFLLEAKVEGVKYSSDQIARVIAKQKGGDKVELSADVVLVSIGRRPYTEGLELEKAGIEKDERGFIKVNESLETGVPGVYAIGDVIGDPMLAHKAEEEGIFCVETICGQKPAIHYDRIPAITYTEPEVASVGSTEEELKEKGLKYRVGKFPFMANSRSRIMGSGDGFVKVLVSDDDLERILGAHIVGLNAGDLIHELVLAMEFGASPEDVVRTCHGHPTLSEAVREACHDASFGKCLNF